MGHIKIGSGLQMQDGTANVKIANNLTTNDSTIALSAAMGAQLNKSLESKQNASTAINTSNIGNQNVTSAFIVRDNKSAHTFSFSWVDDSKFEIYVDGILVRTLIGFREEI
ncbi:hypothetical protein CG709_11205 [Lachnotalea glycerini]|nr:hypothetical protein CG709_11205 [Lachnotalea glycerini]